MQIEYNEKIKRFVIHCTFSENARIAALPNKRFQRRAGVWHAPALSRNSQFILNNLPGALTPQAREVAERTAATACPQYEPFPLGYKFKTEPFWHQKAALDFAWGLPRVAFFMEMGTGKTKVAIDLNTARIQDGQMDAWVVVCPVSVMDNWRDEVAVHCPLDGIRVYVLGGMTAAQRRRTIENARGGSGPFIVVVGHESLQGKFRGGSAYDTLVEMIGGLRYSITVDESHFVKNHTANRARNVEEIAAGAVSGQIMTGSGHDIIGLYQQFQCLDPNIIGIGDFFSFRARYVEMGGYENKQVVGYREMEELMGLLKPYVYQMTKAEALPHLPEKLYTRRAVAMTAEQEKAYKDLEKTAETEIADMARRGEPVGVQVEHAIARYGMLQQITGGFLNYDDWDEDGLDKVRRAAWLTEPTKNPKVRALLEVIEENPDRPMIVWAKYRNEIEQIVEALSAKYGPQSVSQYHGGLGREARGEQLAAFKGGRSRFFVANQQTGGTGLTINEANLVVYFSNSLKLTDREQSEDRCHRIGQKNDVLYVDLVCTGTCDVSILHALRSKREIADFVRDNMTRSVDVFAGST